MKINSNVQTVLNILDDVGATWWIDSGTLLGFIRDNSIIGWDNDFDLSILIEKESEARIVANALIEKGLVIKKYTYKYQIVKIKIMNKDMNIDIQIFEKKSDQLISFFAYIGSKPNSFRASIINIFYWLNARIILRPLEKGMHSRGMVNISKLKLFLCVRVGSWLYKADDILPLQRSGNFNVPYNAQRYLNYRYGDWKNPNKDWDSYTMDGARNY